MKVINSMQTYFESKSINEAYARTAVIGFVSSIDPTVEEISDIKTAVSEAVTNCIVHGYSEQIGKVYITVKIMEDNNISITIRDRGCGIADVKQAREPLFTTCTSGERAGLGFAMMETFMDKVSVRSTPGKGTTVVLQKKIRSKESS